MKHQDLKKWEVPEYKYLEKTLSTTDAIDLEIATRMEWLWNLAFKNKYRSKDKNNPESKGKKHLGIRQLDKINYTALLGRKQNLKT